VNTISGVRCSPFRESGTFGVTGENTLEFRSNYSPFGSVRAEDFLRLTLSPAVRDRAIKSESDSRLLDLDEKNDSVLRRFSSFI
jgi:hypothetical protein